MRMAPLPALAPRPPSMRGDLSGQAVQDKCSHAKGVRGDGRHSVKSTEEWELQKKNIEVLYLTQNCPLPMVVELMEKLNNFKATQKQYKTRFEKWGWKKYQPRDKHRTQTLQIVEPKDSHPGDPAKVDHCFNPSTVIPDTLTGPHDDRLELSANGHSDGVSPSVSDGRSMTGTSTDSPHLTLGEAAPTPATTIDIDEDDLDILTQKLPPKRAFVTIEESQSAKHQIPFNFLGSQLEQLEKLTEDQNSPQRLRMPGLSSNTPTSNEGYHEQVISKLQWNDIDLGLKKLHPIPEIPGLLEVAATCNLTSKDDDDTKGSNDEDVFRYINFSPSPQPESFRHQAGIGSSRSQEKQLSPAHRIPGVSSQETAVPDIGGKGAGGGGGGWGGGLGFHTYASSLSSTPSYSSCQEFDYTPGKGGTYADLLKASKYATSPVDADIGEARSRIAGFFNPKSTYRYPKESDTLRELTSNFGSMTLAYHEPEPRIDKTRFGYVTPAARVSIYQ